MSSQNRLEIVSEGFPSPGAEGSTALSSGPGRASFLRFRIRADEQALEALRHARRSMLREESTLGRREEEPSLQDAVFSPDAIVWPVSPDQHALCLEKIAELEARVRRTLSEVTRV